MSREAEAREAREASEGGGRRGRRDHGRTGPGVASLGVHLVAVALAWGVGLARPEPVQFVSYHIEMVEMPAAAPAEIPEPSLPEDLVVEDPRPTPPRQDPIPPPPEVKPETPKPEPKPRPEPPKPDPTPPQPNRPDPPRERPTETPRSPDPEPSDRGGEAIDVRLEGLRRDYPAYYENIIRQINRCMRWRGAGTPETTVYFVIRKDGSVADLRPMEPSGNIAFDAEALGAVECAGSRFGPLPEALPYERLPVRFTISARSGGGPESP